MELLSLPLGRFTAERNARAKAARADGDRDLAERIGALQKPSVSAWLVDLLARETPEDLQRVLDLGDELREAQAGADRGRLRELAAIRRSLLGEIAGSAASRAEQAGQRVGDAVLEEVQQTLQAALTSPAAAGAVRSGRLLRALDTDGLDPVDLADAVAGGAPQAPQHALRSKPQGSARAAPERDAAEQRRAEERQRAEDRERRLQAARDRAAETARTAREAAARADERKRDAADLRTRVEELQHLLEAAERALDDAESAATAARVAADEAAAEVDRVPVAD